LTRTIGSPPSGGEEGAEAPLLTLPAQLRKRYTRQLQPPWHYRRRLCVLRPPAESAAPLMLAAWAVVPALAVANYVVLKSDPRTAVCGGVAFACLLELSPRYLRPRSRRIGLQVDDQATTQIPSPATGYFSATTAAAPKRHKVVIDRKCMILRTVGETSSTGVRSISSQIKHM
jgi:hypothetical protein